MARASDFSPGGYCSFALEETYSTKLTDIKVIEFGPTDLICSGQRDSGETLHILFLKRDRAVSELTKEEVKQLTSMQFKPIQIVTHVGIMLD